MAKKKSKAQQKEELHWSPEPLAQGAQGIHRIGRPLALGLKTGQLKTWFRSQGQLNHGLALLKREQIWPPFMGRLSRRYKNDLAQLQASQGSTGQLQMAIMNGIKGAAQDTDTLQGHVSSERGCLVGTLHGCSLAAHLT